MDIKPFIMKIGRGKQLAKDLTEEEAYQAFQSIFKGENSDFQTGAFFAAMRVKSESPDEIVGFVRAVRDLAQQIRPHVERLLDFGDPYDGKVKTLNLSPLTAFVLAAAGLPCVIHGAPDIPAKRGVGAGAVLNELGIPIDLSPGQVERGVEELGIGYVHAPHWVPRFEELKPLRFQYGLRSSVNVIEKMWNLANAPVLAVGIYHAPYFKPTSEALSRFPVEKGFVIQGVEGFGELTLRRATKVLEVAGGAIQEVQVDPNAYGLRAAKDWELGGSLVAKRHAEWTQKVLEGEAGLAQDGVVFNAGVKLFWGGGAASVEEGIERAREALGSGRALHRLNEFRKYCEGSKRGGVAAAQSKGE